MTADQKSLRAEDLVLMSGSVRRAVDIVGAAGYEVSKEAISILERVECNEIDSEQGVRMIIRLRVGGAPLCKLDY